MTYGEGTQSGVSRLDFAVYSSVVPMFSQHLLNGEDNRRATPHTPHPTSHIPEAQNRGRLFDITPDTQTKQNSGECKMQRWIKCDNPPLLQMMGVY